MELVRYIHLNPLRENIVENYSSLARYKYCSHAFILGNKRNGWRDVDYVLRFFNKKRKTAQVQYKE